MLAGLGSGVGLVAVPALARPAPLDIAPYRTPYKLERLIVTRSDDPEAFDSKFVDAPLVIRGPDRFYMYYYGFDGVGYQTGLAESDDLLNWRKRGIALGRDLSSPLQIGRASCRERVCPYV